MNTNPLNFVAIDFETATPQHHICAVGIVTVIDGHIIEKYYTLVKPPYNKISKKSIETHHITPDQTFYAPVFPEIFPEIQRRLQNQTVVAHNALGFDTYALYDTMRFYSIPDTLNITWLDTLNEFPETLSAACQKNNIPLDHHDALSDATACAYLHLLHLQKTISPAPKEQRRKTHPSVAPQFNTPDNPFLGLRFVVSGQFITWPDRDDLLALLEAFGARTSSSVSKLTNILITGNEPGTTKFRQMQENIAAGRNAKIITEQHFLDFLAQIGFPTKLK